MLVHAIMELHDTFFCDTKMYIMNGGMTLADNQ